jgi:hypothetical protein
MLVCTVLGTVAAAGIITRANIQLTTALLGAALIVYAIIGFSGGRFPVSRNAELTLGPLAGQSTGVINGATGIFVIPGIPSGDRSR